MAALDTLGFYHALDHLWQETLRDATTYLQLFINLGRHPISLPSSIMVYYSVIWSTTVP
jgi:hypothetical protein